MDIFLQYNLDLAPQSVWNTVSATAASRASLLFLQEAGEFLAGPNYYTTREGFSSYLIKLTLDGCGELTYQSQRYPVPRGHLFWIDCRKWQSYRTHPAAKNWHTMWIHFYGANAAFYHDMFLRQNNGSPVAALPPDSPVPGIIHSLLCIDHAGTNPQKRDLEAANLLGQLISACTLSAMGAGSPDQIPETVQAVRRYLAENFHRKITLDDLGRQFNLNPFYLQKQFKHHIGQSPTEYIIYLRMSRAKELIRSTNKSISQIANLVGIDNLGYFTRQFKQQEGITPHEYSKLWPTVLEDSDS